MQNRNLPAVFQFDNFQVRTIVVNGEPWFVAKDVADALGYTNPQKAVRDHCRRNTPVSGVNESFTLDPQTVVIPEGDIYRLISKSQLPSAERFESWVFDEVLPTIRKTGSYQVNSDPPPTLIAPSKEFRAIYGIARLIGMEKNKAAISANHATIRTTGVDMLDMLGAKKLLAEKQVSYFTPSQLGERLNMSGQAFNKVLVELGLQEKRSDQWCPTEIGEEYSCIVDTGKRHNSGKMITQLHWYENVMDLLREAA